MRAFVALVLVLPVAAAQEAVDPVLTIEPLASPVPPRQEPVKTAFHLDVLCEPNLPNAPTRIVSFWIEDAPPWVDAVPGIWVLPMDATCAGTRVSYDGELTVAVNDTAPASRPAPIVLAASYPSVRGNVTARATVNVTAGYFGLLAAEADQPIQVVSAGEAARFRLAVANRGNAAGVVRFELVDVSAGFDAALPEPVSLESAQEGGQRTREEVVVTLRAPAEEEIVERIGTLSLRVILERASDGSPGDAAETAFVATVREPTVRERATPALGAWALLALAGVAWVRRRG